jgi:peptide/nickel transport system permease protein
MTAEPQPIRRGFRGLGVPLGRIHAPVAPYLAVGVIVLVVGIAVASPLIAPHDPLAVDFSAVNAGSSPQHLLGTDATGRDLLSRLLVGSRTALLGAFMVVAISTVLGTALALTSAWVGGAIDQVISRFIDLLFAFPGLLLAIFATAVFGISLQTAAIALSVSYVPYMARIVRSEAIRERRLPYIQSCVAQGFSTPRVLLRHLLPALYPLIIAQVTISFAYATIDMAAISYLGLGVQQPTPDWGSMVAEGQANIVPGYPQESLYAGICIVAVVVAFTVVGDYLSSVAMRRGRAR